MFDSRYNEPQQKTINIHVRDHALYRITMQFHSDEKMNDYTVSQLFTSIFVITSPEKD